jgi:hypothetical protein
MGEVVEHEFDAELTQLQNTLKTVVTHCLSTNKPTATYNFYKGLMDTVANKRIALRQAHALAAIHTEVHGVTE